MLTVSHCWLSVWESWEEGENDLGVITSCVWGLMLSQIPILIRSKRIANLVCNGVGNSAHKRSFQVALSERNPLYP